MEKTARQQVMEELYKEIAKAMTGDLHRAIKFLKFAREVRRGKTRQRKASRQAMKNANPKNTDTPISW